VNAYCPHQHPSRLTKMPAGVESPKVAWNARDAPTNPWSAGRRHPTSGPTAHLCAGRKVQARCGQRPADGCGIKATLNPVCDTVDNPKARFMHKGKRKVHGTGAMGKAVAK
jgi:hypothetical protein